MIIWLILLNITYLMYNIILKWVTLTPSCPKDTSWNGPDRRINMFTFNIKFWKPSHAAYSRIWITQLLFSYPRLNLLLLLTEPGRTMPATWFLEKSWLLLRLYFPCPGEGKMELTALLSVFVNAISLGVLESYLIAEVCFPLLTKIFRCRKSPKF